MYKFLEKHKLSNPSWAEIWTIISAILIEVIELIIVNIYTKNVSDSAYNISEFYQQLKKKYANSTQLFPENKEKILPNSFYEYLYMKIWQRHCNKRCSYTIIS